MNHMGNITEEVSLRALRGRLEHLLHSYSPALQADEERLRWAALEYEESLAAEPVRKAA